MTFYLDRVAKQILKQDGAMSKEPSPASSTVELPELERPDADEVKPEVGPKIQSESEPVTEASPPEVNKTDEAKVVEVVEVAEVAEVRNC